MKSWAEGSDFNDGTPSSPKYETTVDFNAVGFNFAPSNNANIRFRCNAGNSDFVYIDEIKFEGYGN